jgi:hypothetical protein
VTPNRRGGLEHLPADDFRLHDEEIKCASEYERDSQTSSIGKSEEHKKPQSTAASSQLSGGSSSGSIESDHDGSFDFVAPERKDTKEKKSKESD